MAKKKWPKLPSLLVPLFQCATIYLCRTREEWHQAEAYFDTRLSEIDMLGGATQTFTNAAEQENLYLLGVFTGDVATLVHECAHLAFYVCRDCGIRVDAKASNETYCYLLDRMFSHFEPYIREVNTDGKANHEEAQQSSKE